ncbi:hypothetical protein EQV77_09445 [Halobacillus fulvus]|nr:hypothetical protein EQV77_09445 [Halobacillus fulvus]
MIDDFIKGFLSFEDKKSKKGYQVIGPKMLILFFGIILALLCTSYFFSVSPGLWNFSMVLSLVIALYKVNRKIDTLIFKSLEKKRVEHKSYIERYLTIKLNLNSSIQYKEIYLFLKNRGERGIVRYNLTPYLTMILTAIVTTIGIISKGDPGSVTLLIELLIIVTVILVSMNPVVNGLTNIFFNSKPQKILQISEIVHELFIEKSIKENNKMIGTPPFTSQIKMF